MGKMSRTKGQSGEREFAGLLFDHLGIEVKRHLEQSRSGGHDLVVTDPGSCRITEAFDLFAVEVKRHKTASQGLIASWWLQAVEQANRAEKIPALAYRADRQQWQIALPLYAISSGLSQSDSYESTAALSLSGFCGVIRETANE